MSALFALYRAATALLEPFAPALLRRRAARGKEDPARLTERLGHTAMPRPAGALVWLHGASVGESLSLLPLIERLRAARPDATLLVTSGTTTSAELLAQRLPPGVVHQYAPIDAPRAGARFLDHWKPDLVVFVESEIWPGLILGAKARGAKLALLSARLSAKSLAGWERAQAFAHRVFGAFDVVLAQENETAVRLKDLGARDHGRLNLKLAGAPLLIEPDKFAALKAEANGRKVLFAASTHPGEDEIVLDAFHKIADYALLVIAPRHPVRAPDIVKVAEARGFDVALRTQTPFGAAHVYVADTLGEMGLWFSLADAALIGGSLVPGPGGHNPVEAAQLGCPIITGPHVDNWQGVYADLIGANAVLMAEDALSLTGAFSEVLLQPALAAERAERARAVVAGGGGGGLDAAVEALLRKLPPKAVL